jgi:hypothetical protein
MWYLNRGEDLDMNVEGAWQEGVTGRGVAVTILDDGENRASTINFQGWIFQGKRGAGDGGWGWTKIVPNTKF